MAEGVADVQQQAGGYLGVGFGAVGVAAVVDVQCVRQAAEFVAGLAGQHSSRQLERTDQAAMAWCQAVPLGFGKQEVAVEAGVVGGQHIVADEIQQFGKHLLHRRCVVDHPLRDAGERGDERWNAYATIDQGHVAVDHCAIDDAQGRHLGDAVAASSAQAGRFEIEHHDGLVEQRWSPHSGAGIGTARG